MANLSTRICVRTPAAIDAYGTWVADLVARGWDAYLGTPMFHHLPGSLEGQIAQMHLGAAEMFLG